jgi:hypothetical protein
MCQKVSLRLQLHPFGNHPQPQALGQRHHHFGDGCVVGVGHDVAHKTLVDLELVQRQALEVSQRRIAGAKVVQREAMPWALSVPILAMMASTSSTSMLSVSSSLRRCGLARVCAPAPPAPVDKIALLELPRAHVDGHRQVRQLGLRGPQRPAGRRRSPAPSGPRANQTGFLGQRDKFGR